MAGNRVISGVLTLKDKNFASGVKKANRGTKDMQRQVKKTGNSVKRFGRNSVSAFKNVATSVGGMVAAITGAGIGAALAGSVLEAEEAFNRLEAKTGTTGKTLENLQGTANDVFKAGFGDSIGTVANDVGTLQTMFNDLNKNELTNLAQGAYTMSDLWGTGINEVSRSVKTMTSNFEGLSESSAMDLMTTAFQKTGDYSGDLLDTFSEYSTYFADMGMNAEEFTNILIKGSEAGAFSIDKVGDGIKELGVRTIDGSKTTAEGFATIGLNADEMAQKFAAGGDSAKNAFAATMAGLAAIEDPVKRNQAGVALMGTMYEDLGADVVNAMGNGTNALGEFEGATARAGETIQNGFGAKMKQLWREIKVGATEAFNNAGGAELLDGIASAAQRLVPHIRNIVTNIVNFGTTVQTYMPQIKSAVDTAKQSFVAVKNAAVGVYNFFVNNWGTILPIVAGVTATVAAFKIGVMAVMAKQRIWKGVTDGIRIATLLLNGTLAISPLGWVALAIGAVVAIGIVLWKNWDTIREKAGLLWTKVKEVFGGIYNWGVSKIQPVIDFFGSLGDKFNDFVSAITSFKMPSWVSSIGSKISGAASAVGNLVNGSHANGLNYVPFDGYRAELHKGEMVIPAKQSEAIRKQGYDINSIGYKADMHKGETVASSRKSERSREQRIDINNVDSSRPNHTEQTSNKINININGVNKSTSEIMNELVPQLKLKLANM